MLFGWHAGLLEDAFDLQLLDVMDGLVELSLKFALDRLFEVEDRFN